MLWAACSFYVVVKVGVIHDESFFLCVNTATV